MVNIGRTGRLISENEYDRFIALKAKELDDNRMHISKEEYEELQIKAQKGMSALNVGPNGIFIEKEEYMRLKEVEKRYEKIEQVTKGDSFSAGQKYLLRLLNQWKIITYGKLVTFWNFQVLSSPPDKLWFL